MNQQFERERIKAQQKMGLKTEGTQEALDADRRVRSADLACRRNEMRAAIRPAIVQS